MGVGEIAKSGKLINGPIIYGAEFELPLDPNDIPRNTFLDMSNWGKVNKHNIKYNFLKKKITPQFKII